MVYKLKIKRESLPNRCEICHKDDHFNSEKGYCSRCSVVYSVPQNSIKRLGMTKPAKITIKDNGNRLVLTGLISRFAGLALSIIFFSIAILPLIAYADTWASSTQLLYFILIFVVSTVILSISDSHVVLQISKDEIMFSNKISRLSYTIRKKDIEQIYCQKYEMNNGHNVYTLSVKTRDGKHKALLSSDNTEIVLFIEHEIENKLGIKDRIIGVDGELSEI